MKQKIILSLITLFALFALGALIANVNINKTTSLFKYLIKLHQIEDLRHDLLEQTLKVQSDLYTVNTPLGNDLGAIVINVSILEDSADNCTSCHHEPEVLATLESVNRKIDAYKNALSFYITASANKKRVEALKTEASLLGNQILFDVEKMAFDAGKKIQTMTAEAQTKVQHAKMLMLFTLLLSFLFGTAVAVHLTRAITRPTIDLVQATRKIASGDLGYTVTEDYQAEFGEFASNLNAMSLALKKNYTKLQNEISERKQTEVALRESEERYELAARAANDGLWDWDLKTNTVYFSPRWKSMLGFHENEIINSRKGWLKLIHPEDRRQLQQKIAAHLNGDTTHFEDEHRMRHKDGSDRWMLNRGIAVRDASGKAYRVAGSQTDVTERKTAEDQLLHDAFHDTLTELPNRALFMNRLKHAINASQRRRDYQYAVLFIDLDRFKVINDSLGHVVGDQLLIAVSKRIKGFLRPTDTVARLGGDEFAILLEDIHDDRDAIHIAERIKKDLPQPFTIMGYETFTSASIGIALGSAGYDRPDHLLRDADIAMYQAKSNGKSRYEIFDEAMHASTISRLQTETALRKAIENREFVLHYQPIQSVTTGQVTGFEALIRWQHPEKGLIFPNYFIGIAEETGLIIDIGQWVIGEVCRKASQWKRACPEGPLPTVNLNLSSNEFTPNLIEQMRQILKEIDIDPLTLRFEVTESTLMQNPEYASLLLWQLKEMGIGLHIDDFGTGYSSLSYLHQFPFDALKIDRSFVNRMTQDRENLEIVKTIIALAHNLGMNVIAEGVETLEESNILQELGCEYLQGYLISKPLDEQSMDHYFPAVSGSFDRNRGEKKP